MTPGNLAAQSNKVRAAAQSKTKLDVSDVGVIEWNMMELSAASNTWKPIRLRWMNGGHSFFYPADLSLVQESDVKVGDN
jgi:hypothetical protein